MFQNYSAESISCRIFILGRACERGFLFSLIESVSLIIMLWSIKKPPEKYFSIYSFDLLFSNFTFLNLFSFNLPLTAVWSNWNNPKAKLTSLFLICWFPQSQFLFLQPKSLKRNWRREKNKEGFGMSFYPLEHKVITIVTDQERTVQGTPGHSQQQPLPRSLSNLYWFIGTY